MTNLLRFDFNDRDGIFEVIEDGYWVRATDYDALAAKLAEVEEMKRLLAMDKINLRGELAGVQGKLDAAEAALPAVYRLAMGDAAEECESWEYCYEASQMAQDIRALPTPTAAELMARIQTGEKE